MSPEIQRADERLRRRWLLALTLVAALGAAAVFRLDAYLTELQSLASEARPLAAVRTLRAARATLAAIAAGGVAFSLYLGTISWRTLASERYPPPGTRVLSDTRVRRGAAARRRGRAGLALATVTLALTLAVAARADRLLSGLLDTTLKPTRIEFRDHPAPPLPSP